MNLSIKELTGPLLGAIVVVAAIAVGFLLAIPARAIAKRIAEAKRSDDAGERGNGQDSDATSERGGGRDVNATGGGSNGRGYAPRLVVKSIVTRFIGPLILLFPLVTTVIALGFTQQLFPVSLQTGLNHVIRILFVAWVAWSLSKIFFVIEDLVFDRYRVDVRDNLRARKIRTQTRFLKQLGTTIIAILGFGVILTTFSSVRQVGTTLLASAGIVGVVLGFAAQKALGLVIAGFQVAFTQPIRIDDVVVVENEWGRIEEITLTYVVVRIWDLRRLVLPINYFIEHPFQNWTRVSSDILGSVFLHLDYSMPVQPMREEFQRLLDASADWDHKVGVVQVTDSDEHGMEVRFLMSAEDSSKAWDLRCYVRENMISFVQDNYPNSLSFVRTDYRPKRGESPQDGPNASDARGLLQTAEGSGGGVGRRGEGRLPSRSQEKPS